LIAGRGDYDGFRYLRPLRRQAARGIHRTGIEGGR